MKRYRHGLLALLLLTTPAAEAAGLWPLSYTQRHDANGKPFPGAKAYFYDASTGDPIAVYREYSLATPHTNPVEADGNGVFPGVYVDGTEDFYRFRVTTSAGVVISDDAVIPNIGPSEGEGGEPPEPVEASALAKTGDIKARYGTGTHVGWLPCNGLTMGSALSGANYAAAENEALFLFLWQADESLAVVGGRGVSAAADWAANKRLTLPDMRGRVLAGLDTMGNSAAGIVTGLDELGEIAGAQNVTLSTGQIPQMSLQSGAAASSGAHTHFVAKQTTAFQAAGSRNPNAALAWSATGSAPDYTLNDDQAIGANAYMSSSSGAHTHAVTGTVGAASPIAVSTLTPISAVTIYIKK